ncbi:MAG: type III-A CRISPR-associated protein Cas10/Csm1 [Helicobacteraceae bacterium]|jgi:CRISPR-associated protein Csm1|nr:type III-A CRISPR-associated protein Cas10/Csm1 [Helicobacteraceae bacterium]
MTEKINQIALEALKKPFLEAREKGGAKALKHLFANGQYFQLKALSVETIFPISGTQGDFKDSFRALDEVDKYDLFAADYLLRKHLSFIGRNDVSLYESCKQEAILESARYALSQDKNAKDLLMISGDFFGIQRFIFEATPADKAAKILRAKSAYVQLLTRVVAFYIVDRLGLSYLSIISTSAGKFEILGIDAPEARKRIEEIQRELNIFFTEKYFGETGIGVSVTECSFDDLQKEKYRNELRKRIDKNVEATKLNKFDLLATDPILNYDEDIDNETLCHYCNKRKVKSGESCEICDQFITIGERLVEEGFLAISKGGGDFLIFGDYYISFTKNFDSAIAIYDTNKGDFRGYAKWEISSYVKHERHSVTSFEELANASCNGDEEQGIKALISLKGDVDGMGNFIKNSDVTTDFVSFNFFSRIVDYFFSVYAPYLMREKYKNLYTVFAGGDDLFVLGAWDEVLGFAKELREDFRRFSGNGALSFSVGMTLTKPNKPVNFIARVAEEQLERSKAIDKEKDAISMFGECVKWESYIKVLTELLPALQELETKKSDLTSSAFLYRLLELIDMSKNAKDINSDKFDIKNLLWKSKLRYTFARNFDRIDDDDKANQSLANRFLGVLDKAIDNNPSETKMVLCEYIYKRRKQ